MSPESFNRLQNPSKEDFDRFVAWLFSHTLTEVRSARGDSTATKAAWLRYFQRGLKADLLLGELMDLLPELFQRVQYPAGQAQSVLAMLKTMNFVELGIQPPGTGVKSTRSGT